MGQLQYFVEFWHSRIVVALAGRLPLMLCLPERRRPRLMCWAPGCYPFSPACAGHKPYSRVAVMALILLLDMDKVIEPICSKQWPKRLHCNVTLA